MRSNWKINSFFKKKLYISKSNHLISFNMQKGDKNNLEKKKLYCKNKKISFELLNTTFEIYNGNSFYKHTFKKDENLIKKCIGIFVSTRKIVKHSILKKNEKTKIKK